MARVRSSGALPLAVALSTAALLTGAAVFTVVRVSCHDPGQYVQHNGIVELIGGCVERDDLPVGPKQPEPVKPAEQQSPPGV
ncbi:MULTISPECIES: hypothetical protein [unclassified Crossiella]|uniref:hypothetical protein n=1 Tax=unclassified Crossiella TaxID=2620835 RepID=UPI001FFEC2B1|nr:MULTISPECIES: hypothetical protein [unclassified Crossiella]MCK2237088.1 hypothetical protein [Crossiella sp. S99.2]MCK2250756.1 hypothetical protein [Crossiella sp. S99.1]